MKGGRTYTCMDCGMYDPHDGAGDGIGSCDCPRCEDCGAAPGMCDCDDDGWCEGDDGICDDPYCCAPPEPAAVTIHGKPVTTVDTGGLT